MEQYKSPINGQPLPIGKPFEQGEQQREIARRGGKKSQEKQRAMRTLRKELEFLLAEEMTDESGKKITVQTGIASALVKSALEGNTRAYELIRDTIGQKPVEQVEMEMFTPKAEAVMQLERDLRDG